MHLVLRDDVKICNERSCVYSFYSLLPKNPWTFLSRWPKSNACFPYLQNMAARRVLGQFLAYFWPSLDVACAIGGLILLPSEQVNALGWSIQAPLFCVLIRLIWLLLLLVLAKAANRASRAGRARSVSRIEHILHEAFPYVAYVPLAVLCLVRLISDPPKAPHDSNARFWTFLVFGFLCILQANRFIHHNLLHDLGQTTTVVFSWQCQWPI